MIVIIALSLISFFLGLYFSYSILMPLDHSIIFDAGWRILSHQVPFREFTTPHGILPGYFQAMLFSIFGANWLSFALHAAIINCLFSLLIYFYLKRISSSKLAFNYALISSLLLYPPVGGAFSDQDAFFLLLLSATILERAVLSTSNSRATFWTLLPISLTACYFCKQIPTIFFVPVCFFAIFFLPSKERHKAIAACSLGIVIIFAFIFLFTQYYGLDLAYNYFF